MFYLQLDFNFKENWQVETFLNLAYTSSLCFGLDFKSVGKTKDDILTDMNVNLTFKATTFALIINFTESRVTYYRMLAWNTIYNVLNYHTLNYYLTLVDRIFAVLVAPNEVRSIYNLACGC